MNVTADIKPFATPFINPYCERSVGKPSEASSSYLTNGRPLNHNTVPSVNETIQGNVAKSESLRGDCVLEVHSRGRVEEGSISNSEGTILNTVEPSVSRYASRYSTNTHQLKEESYSGSCNDGSRVYIAQPETISPQSNSVAPKVTSDAQTRHLDKRAERFDLQSLPSSSENLSYHEPPYPVRFTTYLPPHHESGTLDVEQTLRPTNPPISQKRTQETWNLPRPYYRAHRPYGWHGDRQPCLDRSGLNKCGPTPMKDLVHGMEEDGQSSIQMDITQKTQRREDGPSSYPTMYQTVRQSRQSERVLGVSSYMANTTSETIVHEQYTYGDRPAQFRRTHDQGSDYDRQNWARSPQSHHKQRGDADIRQDPRVHSSFASPHGNSQVVAYIAEGRYNGFSEEKDSVEPMRYSPVIVDCYSLANKDTSSKDLAISSEPAKSLGVPSMAFYDDRIHHQSVGRDPYSDFNAHAHHASQLEPISVHPRGTAELCSQDVQNHHTTPNPSSQLSRARSSWMAEMSYGISFSASTDLTHSDKWSRGRISMDNSLGLVNSSQTPPVQSGSPGEYRSGPHATSCDETFTSQRPLPEQRDPGPSTPGLTTTLEKHGQTVGSQKDDGKTSESAHSTRQSVKRRSYSDVQPSSKEAGQKSPTWQSVKRHSYPDNQPSSSKEAGQKSPTWQSVKRRSYPDNQPSSSKEAGQKSPTWQSVKRHSYPDNQPSSSKEAGQKSPTWQSVKRRSYPDNQPSSSKEAGQTSPTWQSVKRRSYPDNQPSSSKEAGQTSPTWLRISPDINQRRCKGNTPSPCRDLAKAKSACDESGVDPEVQPSSDLGEQSPSRIRITAQDGVISVERLSSQDPSGSPARRREEPKSLHASSALREWREGALSESTNADRALDGSSSKPPEEIPDLSLYAKAFNITDIDDLDDSLDGSVDFSAEERTQSNVEHTSHGICYCSNPFCCGSLSRSRNHFKNSLDPTPKEKRFPCRFCGRRFAHLSTLQNHVRVHTGDRPYQCKYCKKAFAQSGVLKTHLRTHTGDKPFQCPFCGRLFAQSTTLTNHLRIHTGHKPFICKYCSKAFSQPSTLGKHEISHTNERPYPCTICERAFVQQSTLNNHMRSHTGQKPYKCPFCGRGFAQLSTMDRHLKVHTSFRYKPHQCPYCEKDFSYLSNLTNHLQTHSKPLNLVS